MANYRPVHKIADNKDSLDKFEEDLKTGSAKEREIFLEFPTVYIHTWPKDNIFAIYVGESNNIIQRTIQHYSPSGSHEDWEQELRDHEDTAELYIIGHEHFNKSMTLDLENRLRLYLTGVENIEMLNKRPNPQGKYFPSQEFEGIFHQVWRELHKRNKIIFPEESAVKESALFKASPHHKLTSDQEKIKVEIIKKIFSALQKKEDHQLIFVNGEAGTGKTVLNSSTFYDLYAIADEEIREGTRKDTPPEYHMIVNHNEQFIVYQQIMLKLGLQDEFGQIVWKPTSFINEHSPDRPVNVAFVDEAHLLLTQRALGYYSPTANQLQDIMDRAKVTVIMFDEAQILTREQYWEPQVLNYFKDKAGKENCFDLSTQLRINAPEEVLHWIDAFTNELHIEPLSPNRGEYDIRIFTDIEEMDHAIQEKAADKEFKLSRLIATYDWDYNPDSPPENSDFWEVEIGDWHKPWNYQYPSRKKAKQIKDLAWAERKETINEVGSTFTIQGFDLNYAGVILGPSITYQNGKIEIEPASHSYDKATQQRTLSDGTKQSFGETLIKHEVRILMTRGINGLYIYACDDALRQRLLEAIET